MFLCLMVIYIHILKFHICDHIAVEKRSLDASSTRIKFLKNAFVFKALEKQANTLVGKLALSNENFLAQHAQSLVVTMKATRDSESDRAFSIDAKTLEIRAIRALDASVHYFRASLRQKDALFDEPLASCSLVIHVVDPELNTPPKFTLATYEAQVFENNAPDTLLIRVEAIDDDYGENSRITYHLTNKNLNLQSDDSASYASNLGSGNATKKKVQANKLN